MVASGSGLKETWGTKVAGKFILPIDNGDDTSSKLRERPCSFCKTVKDLVSLGIIGEKATAK